MVIIQPGAVYTEPQRPALRRQDGTGAHEGHRRAGMDLVVDWLRSRV